MKIAEVQAHGPAAKLSQPFAWSFNQTDKRASCIVEIIADNGMVRRGECFGPARMCAAIVRSMQNQLVGKSARATELH